MNTEITDTAVSAAGWLFYDGECRWRRAGLAAANLVFTCLPVIYSWVALKGARP